MSVRRKRIQSIVCALLAESGVTEAPAPVQRIARAQGARIFLEAFEGNLSGFLYRDKDEAVIGVNVHHPKVRQNFTMAHGLGHLLLHDQEPLHIDRDFRVKIRNEQSSQGTDEVENEPIRCRASDAAWVPEGRPKGPRLHGPPRRRFPDWEAFAATGQATAQSRGEVKKNGLGDTGPRVGGNPEQGRPQ